MSNNATTADSSGEQTPHIDSEDGLWLPAEFRTFTGQIVFRTPRSTIQHRNNTGELDPYYGLIDETHFGPEDEIHQPSNPKLAPNQITIKQEGEEAVTFTLPDPTNNGN